MNDKKLIWRDCASCARKHLYAAYALLSGYPEDSVPEWLDDLVTWEVLAARGNILRSEEAAGYLGNGGLADGCYAAAEVLAHAQGAGAACAEEDLRLARLTHDTFSGMLDAAPMAAAHLMEAVRELPDLNRKMVISQTCDRVTVSLFGGTGVLDSIEKAARWVEDTFELTGAETAAAPCRVGETRSCRTCGYLATAGDGDPCAQCVMFDRWEPKEVTE